MPPKGYERTNPRKCPGKLVDSQRCVNRKQQRLFEERLAAAVVQAAKGLGYDDRE